VAEGDTIRRLAGRLDAALRGETIVAARSPAPRAELARTAPRLAGRRVDRVESRGKHLLFHLDGGLVIHSHLGIGGGWSLRSPGELEAGRRAWLVLTTPDHEAVQWNGPTLRILGAARIRSDPQLRRLGPDLLAPGFTAALGARSLRRAGATALLGEALLDQTLLAGIGNVFKNEACFAAGLSPWRRIGELSTEELVAVVGIAAEQMRRGAAGQGRPHEVYRQGGRPCSRCRTAISSRGQGDANRVTYWCPSCQR
jgi:endonuclease-8